MFVREKKAALHSFNSCNLGVNILFPVYPVR
jgi:hypothetical protein